MNNKKMDYFGCEINYSCNECECFESDTSSKKEFLCCKYCFNNVICCEECTKNNESFEIITSKDHLDDISNMVKQYSDLGGF